jgi:hypothetical protein
MPLYFVVLLMQIACVVHIMKTGRERYWVMIVVFLPVAGILAYAAVELLPELLRGRTARTINRRAITLIDPDRDLRARQSELERADTVENRRLLAEEHIARGRYGEAKVLYEMALIGVHADDPALLMGLARAQAGLGDPGGTLATLDRLRAAHPNFQSGEAHLLYARSLEGLGRDGEAADEYAALVRYAPGEEVRCRYAELLRRRGDEADARAIFQEVLKNARHGGSRYRREQQAWIDIAERALAGS